MDDMIFAQSIARIRYKELSLISRTKIENLVETKDFNECLRLLQDTVYGDYVSNLSTSYEEGFKHALEDLYREMKEMIPVKEVVDFLEARYDGHNIKSLIKGKLSNLDTDAMLINAGTIPLDSLRIMIKDGNFESLPDELKVSTQKALEDYKNLPDPQSIDITMDKGIYKYMLSIAQKSDMQYLVDTVKLMIDVINIKSFLRIKRQDRGIDLMAKVYIEDGTLDKDLFISSMNEPIENFSNKLLLTDHMKWVKEGIDEYLKNDDIGSIEKFGDNYIIDYIKKAKYVSFGPQPIVAYIIARENEIKVLRIILTGKKNKVNPNIIRERLRDVYV